MPLIASQCSEINNMTKDGLACPYDGVLIFFLQPHSYHVTNLSHAQATAAFVLIHKYDINLFIMTIFLNSLCPWSQPSGGESYTASMMMPI